MPRKVIANRLGRTGSSVGNRISLLSLERVRKRRGEVDRLVKRLYRKGKTSDVDLADKIGVHVRTIGKSRKRLGLPPALSTTERAQIGNGISCVLRRYQIPGYAALGDSSSTYCPKKPKRDRRRSHVRDVR